MKTHLRPLITDRIIDSDTGEVMDEKTVHYIIENEKEFFLTYCKVLGLLKNMKLGEIKTMAWIVSHTTFNDNTVVLTGGIKRIIASDMGISVSVINNSLAPLVEKGILYRNSDAKDRRDAIYYINPEYYWKGTQENRQKMLRLVLELTEKRKTAT